MRIGRSKMVNIWKVLLFLCGCFIFILLTADFVFNEITRLQYFVAISMFCFGTQVGFEFEAYFNREIRKLDREKEALEKQLTELKLPSRRYFG